jgi:hypothetical protein
VTTLGAGADDDFDRLVDRLASRHRADITGFADRLATTLGRWIRPLTTPLLRRRVMTCSATSDARWSLRCVRRRRCGSSPMRRRNGSSSWPSGLTSRRPVRSGNTSPRSATRPAAPPPPGATVRLRRRPCGPPPRRGGSIWCWAPGCPAGRPGAYAVFLHSAADAVAADPVRRRWWEPTEATVKRGRKRVQVHVTRDPGVFPSDDPQALLTRAAEDLLDLLHPVRERLGLQLLPPLPRYRCPPACRNRLPALQPGLCVVDAVLVV